MIDPILITVGALSAAALCMTVALVTLAQPAWERYARRSGSQRLRISFAAWCQEARAGCVWRRLYLGRHPLPIVRRIAPWTS